MKVLADDPDPTDRPRAYAGLVAFAIGTAATLVVAVLLWSTARDRDFQIFQGAARDAENAIATRVETSIALLRATAGLFAGGEDRVTADMFRRYAGRIDLRRQYRGILGIGFTRRIAPEELDGIQQRARNEGVPDFRVWPSHVRDEYHSIVYLEPLDERNRAAIGYDMYTHETRRRAMARARDGGLPAASAVVELVQEIDERKQPGFLVYVPVYRGGIVPVSTEMRRTTLFGFAYSPIRAFDFLSTAFPNPPSIALAIYHGREAQPASLLFASGDHSERPRFETRSTIDVAGEPWTFVFRSSTTFGESIIQPLAVVLGGIALSLLLAVLVQRESVARWSAQRALDRERAARAEAERASVMKDEFLATLSHELRTPLSTIVGWTALLKRGSLPQHEVRNAVEIIARNAKAQTQLIDDLLDMSRIVSGKLRLALEPVDLAIVIEDAVASLRPAAEAKDITLGVKLDRSLAVRGDPTRLQQVIWNLLSNAIKFTPNAGSVDITLARADGHARLTVVDNGEGLEPEALERIFGRFHQVDSSTTRRHGGLGIGLALVRQLVDMHGGKVWAQSDGPGKGATFAVDLPLLMSDAANNDHGAQQGAEDGDLAGVTVLVVEDEPDAREFMRRLLESAGARVHTAATAHEALALIPDRQPDVLLSDIGLPGMDGYALIRSLRESPARFGQLPAAAISAYAREQDRAEALRAGFQAHLTKPVNALELIGVVKALARGKRDRVLGPDMR